MIPPPPFNKDHDTYESYRRRLDKYYIPYMLPFPPHNPNRETIMKYRAP